MKQLKAVLLGGLVIGFLGLLGLVAVAESDSETATLNIETWITVSINNLEPATTVGMASADLIGPSGVNDDILGTGYSANYVGYSSGAAVAISTNTDATVTIHVTDNKLVGTSTSAELDAAGLLEQISEDGTSDSPVADKLGDSANATGHTWTIEPGYHGPALRVEVPRNEYDPADTYTGTVTVTVTAI